MPDLRFVACSVPIVEFEESWYSGGRKSGLQPYSRRSDRGKYLDNLFRMEMIAGRYEDAVK